MPQPARRPRHHPSGRPLPLGLARPLPAAYPEPDYGRLPTGLPERPVPVGTSDLVNLWVEGYVVGEDWDARLCGHPDIRY
jgi:hypothetical protein